MNRKHQKAPLKELTPREIVRELDRYIIGQNAAKKSVAIAIRNRWRRLHTPEHLREEIMPNNIIMIGPTGVGKTEIARRLAKLVNAPFLKIEASKFTEVGYVGRDVESIIRDLTEFAVNMLKGEKAAEVQDKAIRLAEERIMDILVPPVKRRQTVGAEIATEGLVDTDENRTTREKFREKLRGGELEDRTIELDVTAQQLPAMQVFGPISIEEMGVNIQEMFGNIMPKKTKKRKMTVGEARVVLIQEEAQKLIDTESVVKEAIERVENTGIVFLDEIDKIAGEKGSGGGPDVSREGVQRDLLPIVEGTNVLTKYGMVKSDHILFVASGAFHVSKPADLIPELQGRFPIRVELSPLSVDDFEAILTQPTASLIKQYQALLTAEGVALTFTPQAIQRLAQIAFEVNERTENIGARRLSTVMERLLEELSFNAPNMSGQSHEVDAAEVDRRLGELARNEDLSRFIL